MASLLLPPLNGSTTAPEPAGVSSKPRLLVAEDEASVGVFLAQVLSPAYRVEVVADGEMAWQVAQHNRPDLILTDVQMPHLDGISLTRRLRAHPSTAQVPIILLTACASASTPAEGLQAGANDLLHKPFRVREVLACVEKYLSTK